jgi:hypothetical protein
MPCCLSICRCRAVGIDMNAAQGSTLEDVTVYAHGDGQ